MFEIADMSEEEMLALAQGLTEKCLGGVIGIKYDEVSADHLKVSVEVKEHLFQPAGLVHGGVYAAIAEEVASMAGTVSIGAKGTVVGVNNSTDFLKSITQGTIHAVGRPLHRGRSQQLWRVEMTDDDGQMLAISQVRLANLQS